MQFRCNSHTTDCLLHLAARQVIQELLVAGLAFKKNENVDMEIWMTAGSHCTFVVALACPTMQILGVLKTLGKELFPKMAEIFFGGYNPFWQQKWVMSD